LKASLSTALVKLNSEADSGRVLLENIGNTHDIAITGAGFAPIFGD
jgi:hypothetical protein